MKVARQTVCFFLTLMAVLLFWNVVAARAQMFKGPDPLIASNCQKLWIEDA